MHHRQTFLGPKSQSAKVGHALKNTLKQSSFSPQQAPPHILIKAKVCSNYWPKSDLISDLAWFNISLYPLWLTGLCPNCVLHRSAHGPQTDTYRHARTHTHSGPRSRVKTKPGSASVNTAHCYGHSFPASYLRSPWRSGNPRGTAMARVPFSGVILRIARTRLPYVHVTMPL